MRRRGLMFLGIVGAVALLAGLLSATLAQGAGNGQQGRFLVFTNGDPAVNKAVRQGIEDQGGRSLVENPVAPGLTMVVARVSSEGAGQLAGIPGVRQVAPDLKAALACHTPNGKDSKDCTPTPTPTPGPEPTPTPTPAPAGEQLVWGVDRIDADVVWSTDPQAGIGTTRSVDVASDTSNAGQGVVAAIMDTGIDLSHPDLAANLDVNGDLVVSDADGHVSCSGGACGPGGGPSGSHGTHVAGIVAAVDNTVGVIGVAPRAKLLSVNVFAGGGYFSDVVAGYQYLVIRDAEGNITGRRADVVNQSFGWTKQQLDPYPSAIATLQTVINDFWSAGGVLVAAAGNEGNPPGKGDNITYPARLDNELAVGATSSSDGRASFSSTGPALDVMAPGVAILSTVPGGYDTFSGTSMASPHAAGAAALVVHALGVGWSNATVINALGTTAVDLGSPGFDEKYGNGLVKADSAVAAVTP